MAELRFAGILGTGHYAPEKILSNADLEKMVDTSDEWIRTRTGIATRHIASASETTSDLCVKAAEKALEAAGKTIDDIDFILVATASPDYVVPSTACMVQDKMGAKHAGAMDISAGCSGYIYAVACASNMVKAGMYDNVLVIGAEILSGLLTGRTVLHVFSSAMAQEQRSLDRWMKATVFWHLSLDPTEVLARF